VRSKQSLLYDFLALVPIRGVWSVLLRFAPSARLRTPTVVALTAAAPAATLSGPMSLQFVIVVIT
jgi:hypothetical protein